MNGVAEKNRSKKKAEIKYDVHDNREQTGNTPLKIQKRDVGCNSLKIV
jgi:hypothetical protein